MDPVSPQPRASAAHDYIAEMALELGRLAEVAGDEALAKALVSAGQLAQSRLAQSDAA